jgi:hypothetical protein
MERKQQSTRESSSAQSAGQRPSTETRSTATSENGRLLRARFGWLQRFTDEDLQELSFCESGAPLRPGEYYFDISHPENGAFVGRSDLLVPEGACLVSQRDLSPRIWEKLTRFP